ncbi:hypothetical protein A7985_17155 [Pseudoalteromonas luteoviolacea]|uniref:Carboxypeptidase regulatory-like domain-containing protein n=1 Tax=Pseudoalteromonas luteoviolacea TaxID=43657 RepID=A0A1C0TMT5_9GAMM|nr:hypothetical protein [Pseudoalteromonas luteoviolacea]OCQ20160.1 hypothetical protein A7985_17155 [Pseudoalteromonas luteoviolacea]
MGNKNFKLTKLALALGLTVSLAGCFSDNDNDVTVTPPDPDPGTVKVPTPDTPAALSSYVSVTVTDSLSGDAVDNATITFFEAGEASANVTDLSGEAITTLTSADGSFAFKLKEDANLESITLSISAANYLANASVVSLANEGATNVSVNLVSADKAATKTESNLATTEGKLDADIIVDTDAAGVGATVSIPATVELQNAAGEAVAGSVNIEVVTADLEAADGEASAASIIPGGLNSGSAAEVLVPAAVVTVNITATQGDTTTTVKQLSEAITVTTDIADTYRTVDGNELVAGNTFDVYTFDETKAQWTKLQDSTNNDTVATVGAKVDNKFPTSFQTNHFSSFVPVERVAACTDAVSFTLSGTNVSVPAAGLFMQIRSNRLALNEIVNSSTGTLFAEGQAAKNGVTVNSLVNVNVVDANGNVWGSANNVNLCGGVTVPVTAPVTYVNQDFSLTYTCSNTDQATTELDFTGALVRYNQAGKAPLIAAESANGTYALTGLESGATYEVSVIPVGVDVGDASLTVPNFVAADGEAVSFNVGRSNCQFSEVSGSGS